MQPTVPRTPPRRRALPWLLVLSALGACASPTAQDARPPVVDSDGTEPASEAKGVEPAAPAPATSAVDNSREHFDLPPLPASDILGADDDGDHIRDDVARYIDERFADNEWARLAARQIARAFEHRLVAADDREGARAAYDEDTYGFSCLVATLGVTDAIREKRLIMAEIIDTEPRLRAYFSAEDLIRGATYRGLSNLEDGCLFDREGLSP